MTQGQGRLDQFTDAAFAFAVTLLVIGGAEPALTSVALRNALLDIPAFAIGFAILATFWLAHVRWRRMRGDGGVIGMLLSLALVFLVLIYVQLLQLMARSFAAFLGASGNSPKAGLGEIFFAYGSGFMAMSIVTALLFFEAARSADLPARNRHNALGEGCIWSILGATGLVSTLLSQVAVTQTIAPFAYATLPISIGLFSWRFKWAGDDAAEESAGD